MLNFIHHMLGKFEDIKRAIGSPKSKITQWPKIRH